MRVRWSSRPAPAPCRPASSSCPWGRSANKLIGTETLGTGMPCFKGLQVDVTPLAARGGVVVSTTVENVACPFCGCLCDDLIVEAEGTEILKVKLACSSGQGIFMDYDPRPRRPLVDGREVEWDEAVAEAASILSAADSPLIYGLSSSASEAQRKAVALADKIGAVIDSTSSVCHGPTGLAMQAVGEPTCTLGEVRDRADLVVFWGCNPDASHLRHFPRFSLTAKGTLTPNGRADRTMYVVDVRPTGSFQEGRPLPADRGRQRLRGAHHPAPARARRRAVVRRRRRRAGGGAQGAGRAHEVVPLRRRLHGHGPHHGAGAPAQRRRAVHPRGRAERLRQVLGHPHARARQRHRRRPGAHVDHAATRSPSASRAATRSSCPGSSPPWTCWRATRPTPR